MFKAEAEQDVPILHPHSHATLAREYASQYTDDTEAFHSLLETIQNWDIFLMFTIIDGWTKGKDYGKLIWFIDEVKKV